MSQDSTGIGKQFEKDLADEFGLELVPGRELSAQYLAGLFDGEGCIGVYKRTSPRKDYTFKLTISNNYVPILNKIKSDWAGSIFIDDKCPAWYCSHTKAKEFINFIIPFSIIKTEQLNLSLQYFYLKEIYKYKSATSVLDKFENISRQLKEQKEIANNGYRQKV
jgi:hypothetical protein